ncbi:MAG: thiamine diphosphokinase [Schwartzia sp.]|nr:thiamine diphosphokinase [Schwartzia sp. (in: firmicutes)]
MPKDKKFTLTLPWLSVRMRMSLRANIANRKEASSYGDTLLVLGGRAPSPEWLGEAAKARTLVCVDRGLDAARAAGLRPVRVIGDFDSVSKKNLGWLNKQSIPIDRYPKDKDFTDTQLALMRMRRFSPFSFMVLTGSFGGRLDHALSNVYSLIGSGLTGALADEHEFLLPLHGAASAIFHIKKIPSVVSLLPLSARATGVTLLGTKWQINGATLKQTMMNAISNRLDDSPASDRQGKAISVSLEKGELGIYMCWE